MPTIYRNKINFGGSIYLAGSGITAGIITPYGGSTAPTGWLMCDGSAVSRTDYSQLFDAIGTTYGSGDGSTTFNLPDLRGRVVVGEGTGTASDATAHALGQTSGEETHTVTEQEMPSHGHRLTQSSSASYEPRTVASGFYRFTTATAGAGTTGTLPPGYPSNLSLTGGGQAHNNMQPYTVLNYIISIGSQNGGFTHLTHDGVDYQGGIEDEYLLLPSTITALETWLSS